MAQAAGELVSNTRAAEVKLAAALLAASFGFAAMNVARLDRVPIRLKAFVDAGTAAGFVELVAEHGKVVQLSAVGYQDLETKTPMAADTIFQVMSLTKAVTAAAAMTLVDDGLISPIDPVEKFVPEFKGQLLRDGSKPARAIEVADLMSHTSGLAGGFPGEFKDTGKNFDRTLADLAAAIGKTPLESQPGAVWRYSGAGMATLGRIVEVVSGKPYAEYVAARIFEPLGMKDSFFFPSPDKYSRIASVYTDDHGTLKKADVNLYRKGAVYPAPEGGLYTTAADYFRFYRMLMDGGKPVLSPAAAGAMTMNHTGELKAGFAPGQGYGFGLCVVRSVEGMFRFNSIGTFSHGGAWRTYAFGDPRKDLIGILMFQRTNGGGDVADETNAFIEMVNAAVATQE